MRCLNLIGDESHRAKAIKVSRRNKIIFKMISVLYVLGLMTVVGLFVDAHMLSNKYCNIASCRGQPHTLCMYPFLTFSRRCGRVQSWALDQATIQQLLEVHNNLRAYVASGRETRGSPGPQPAARNLGPLTWSPELAAIAQTWANQCEFNHDKCRDTGDFSVGQNLAYYANTGPNRGNVSELVKMWYNEVSLFDSRGVRAYVHLPSTGHYTQLVWAKTTKLGCGIVRYNADGRWNTLYLVCNYGPTGNWSGQPIYEIR